MRDSDVLDNNGFFTYCSMRTSLVDDCVLHGVDNHPHHWMIRGITNGRISTLESRKQGKEQLWAFLMANSQALPAGTTVELMDRTDQTEPLSMDHFLLDYKILELVQDIFLQRVANRDFVTAYPETARLLFAGPQYPTAAILELGYSNEEADDTLSIMSDETAELLLPGLQDGNYNSESDSSRENRLDEGSNGNHG